MNYGINLPSTPQTNSFIPTTPNSELLNPTDFTAGNDPTVAGTGVVIGSDVSTFVNELIDGGSVTIYDAIGTPANLQLRWAKTDSVANGGADTWELFYQTDATATGANPAWINAGSDFIFDANGQLNPPITNLALSRCHDQWDVPRQYYNQQSHGRHHAIRQHKRRFNREQYAAERLRGGPAQINRGE